MKSALRILISSVLLSLCWTSQAEAQNCLKLTGTIQDLTTRQPVAANLYVQTPSGQIDAGRSNENGQFSVEISCQATALLIANANYRAQRLLLTPSFTASTQDPIQVTIPLIPVNFQQVSVRSLKSEEFSLLSPKANPTSKQRSLFFMSDVYTKAPVRARTCFHYITADWTNCLDPDVEGRFELAFAEKDELTVEVKSPGFDFYQGILTIEANGGRLRHDYQLYRDLVALSVKVVTATGAPTTENFRCELRPVTAGAPNVSMTVNRNWQSSYLLFPQVYRLILTDQSRQIRHQEELTLREGLNYKTITLKQAPAAPTVASTSAPAKPVENSVVMDIPGVAALHLPDSIPPIYFQQSSYELRPESEQVLRAVAAYLKKNLNVQVRVMGHTDNVGDPAKNITLSQYRAMVTATFLRRLDIADERMNTIGYGSRFPLAPNDSEENKAKNRRVTLKLIDK